LYFRDYANHWGEALGRVSLPPFNDAGDGAEQLASLTAANSPLLQLLVEIRENTRFQSMVEAADEVATQAGKAEQGDVQPDVPGKGLVAAAGKARQALAKSLPDTAKKALQRRFEPLHRLLDDNNGPAADLTPALLALNDLQLLLSGLARA
ncbi:type VI secretion system membrane subunit TssM, partial [Pseudomonas sp. MWU13-2625]